MKTHEIIRELIEKEGSNISTEEKAFEKESYLGKEDQENSYFYFVLSGSFELEKDEEVIGTIGQGDYFGHISLLTERNFVCNIKATRNSRVMAIPKEHFLYLLQKSHEFTRDIVITLKTYLHHLEIGRPFKRDVKTIGLIGATPEFIKAFKNALPKKFTFYQGKLEYGNYYLMTASVDEQEKIQEIQLSADKIIRFPIEKEQGVELTGFDYMNGGKTRFDNDEDIQRLARFSASRSIGLVLGSGGSRCAAQIGILRAIEEEKIPIDRIGGSGAGALFAALYAMGTPSKDIHRLTMPFLKNGKNLIDYTFPYISIAKGHTLEKRLRKIFGETRIEELKIPFFCVSTDLNHIKQYVHTKGEIWKAIRATLSIPGIFPPVCIDEHLLIDGSFTNMLPLDVMENFQGGGHSIAVDTAEQKCKSQKRPFPPYISGVKILFQKLFPFGRKSSAPPITHTIIRSGLLSSYQKKQSYLENSPPDVLIQPPLENYYMLDFEKFESIYRSGYKYAKQRSMIWKRKLLELD